MINSTGVPAKNSLVQKERRQVCEVIHSFLGFTSTTSLLPFLYECLTGLVTRASFAIVLICLLNSALVCEGLFFFKSIH